MLCTARALRHYVLSFRASCAYLQCNRANASAAIMCSTCLKRCGIGVFCGCGSLEVWSEVPVDVGTYAEAYAHALEQRRPLHREPGISIIIQDTELYQILQSPTNPSLAIVDRFLQRVLKLSDRNNLLCS